MPVKMSFDAVQKGFRDRNLTLLSRKYFNSYCDLEYLCDRGHEGKITWNKVKQGRGCAACSGNKRLDIDSVRKSFESRGYDLLSDKYINSNSKLKFKCNNGHLHEISWSGFKQGQSCAICAGNIKLTIDKIRKAFSDRGWILISDKYVNSSTKLNFICNKKHNHAISWADFNSGNGCLHCSRNKKKSIEFARRIFSSRGWTLTSSEYIDTKTHLNFICDKGHKQSATLASAQAGSKCLDCTGLASPTIEYLIDQFRAKGWELLETKYKNNHSKLKCLCPKGHQTTTTWSSFRAGIGCFYCSFTDANRELPAYRILYYIRFLHKGTKYYKIGITSKTVKERFRQDNIPFTSIYEHFFEVGKDAYDREQKILERFKEFLITKDEYFLRGGNTEVFTWDVLNLDHP